MFFIKIILTLLRIIIINIFYHIPIPIYANTQIYGIRGRLSSVIAPPIPYPYTYRVTRFWTVLRSKNPLLLTDYYAILRYRLTVDSDSFSSVAIWAIV